MNCCARRSILHRIILHGLLDSGCGIVRAVEHGDPRGAVSVRLNGLVDRRRCVLSRVDDLWVVLRKISNTPDFRSHGKFVKWGKKINVSFKDFQKLTWGDAIGRVLELPFVFNGPKSVTTLVLSYFLEVAPCKSKRVLMAW